MKTVALVVAAGSGTRAGPASDLPKQYASLGGKPLLHACLQTLCAHPRIDAVTVVIDPKHRELYATVTSELISSKLRPPVSGGATRQGSVLAGLESLANDGVRHVLIHDAARPFLASATIDSVLDALASTTGAIAAVPLSDTLKRAAQDRTIATTLDRTGLWRAQTPQAFDYPAIVTAHRSAARQNLADFTDDAAIAEWAGLTVTLVPDSPKNTKITTSEDLAMAQKALETALEPCTGSGFDVHRFAPGDHVWLCGVKVPHTHTLEGHSDADVGLHALTDAILGALGDGDIGQHFPPTDETWRGAASHLFLRDAARRVVERGGRITNVDVTLLCEAPKVGPHRDHMRAAIAEILALPLSRVGVKATTTEGLGFPGRREGIAAMATATLLLPPVTV